MAKAHTLVDNFNDDTPDTTKWNSFADTVHPSDRAIREVNGRLEIRPAGGVANGYGGYQSLAAYDLTGSEFRVEVVRTLNAAEDASTILAAYPGSGHLDLRAEGGWLICSYFIGSYVELARVPYDPEAHRWWRLRERDGTTYWETSSDGALWEVQGFPLARRGGDSQESNQRDQRIPHHN